MSHIYEELIGRWRHQPEAAIPAIPPVPATPTGGHVKLAELANGTAAAFTDGKAWLDHTATVQIPALLAEVQRLQASPIVQAMEGVTLSPAAEQAIATLVTLAATAAGVEGSQMANPEAGQQPDAEPAGHVA